MKQESDVRPHYRLLTEQQIERIHQATLEVLETTGVKVLHKEGIQLLQNAACTIKGDNLALIPSRLVDECIQSAPSQVTIYSRQADVAMRLAGRNSYYGLGTDLPYTQDLYTGTVRPSVLQDVVNCARVADACQEIDFIGSSALPGEVPVASLYVESFRAQVENSVKPIFFTAASQRDLALIIEMAAVVAGGKGSLRKKPFLIHYSEPTSPLTHSSDAVSKLLQCAETGVPICYAPAALRGGTAPMTNAGAIVQANAEALSGIVLHQLKAKGAPIISGFSAATMDMRTMVAPYGTPEGRLANSTMADLFHHYGIPAWSTTGSDTNSLDAQATMEHALCILMASLDGSNLVHNIGYLGQGMLGSPAAIVMCDEIISYARWLLRGFSISPEHLAVDTIHQVGPGGNFLAEEHTVKFLRSELWQAKLVNRQSLATSLIEGSRRYEERLLERTKAILETHEPAALSEEIRRELAEIASRAA